MYGAIIGDLAGSIYEYDQTKEIKSITIDKIIDEKSFYSDDTILTIAIADAILNDRDYDKYLRYYINLYSSYKPDFEPYFKNPFSKEKCIERAKIVAKLMLKSNYITEEEVIKNSRLATMPTHNSEQAILAATKIALIIFYLRKGFSLQKIYNKLNITVNYIPFTHFNTTCADTIDNCLYVLFNSNSFEDAIKKVIALGGDTDTNACIVGSMAETLYGIDNELIKQANDKLPKEFVRILRETRKISTT